MKAFQNKEHFMFRPHGSRLRELSFLQKVGFLHLRSSSRQHPANIRRDQGGAKARCSRWHHLVRESTTLSYYQHPPEPDRLQVPLRAIPQTTDKPGDMYEVPGEGDICFGFAVWIDCYFSVNKLTHCHTNFFTFS